VTTFLSEGTTRRRSRELAGRPEPHAARNLVHAATKAPPLSQSRQRSMPREGCVRSTFSNLDTSLTKEAFRGKGVRSRERGQTTKGKGDRFSHPAD